MIPNNVPDGEYHFGIYIELNDQMKTSALQEFTIKLVSSCGNTATIAPDMHF